MTGADQQYLAEAVAFLRKQAAQLPDPPTLGDINIRATHLRVWASAIERTAGLPEPLSVRMREVAERQSSIFPTMVRWVRVWADEVERLERGA